MDRDSVYSDMSLSASLRDFDPERSMHQSAYSAHSNMHSSRWSAPPPDAEESEAESEGPWAPPAWQNHNNKWYRKSYLQESSPAKSRTTSASPFEQRLEREVTPSSIPLPESPRKMTPRTSPEPVDSRHLSPDTIASRLQSPSVEPEVTAGAEQSPEEEGSHKRDGCTCSFLPSLAADSPQKIRLDAYRLQSSELSSSLKASSTWGRWKIAFQPLQSTCRGRKSSAP